DMKNIKLTCHLIRDFEDVSVLLKFDIKINSSDYIDSLKDKIYEKVQIPNDNKNGFSSLELQEGEESNYWNGEKLLKVGYIHVIVDSPLIRANQQMANLAINQASLEV
ncbi:2885_t:CDS:2, partial [Funneliformis geosporum]